MGTWSCNRLPNKMEVVLVTCQLHLKVYFCRDLSQDKLSHPSCSVSSLTTTHARLDFPRMRKKAYWHRCIPPKVAQLRVQKLRFGTDRALCIDPFR
ncbi:hypothetical protein RRG08_011195 [Elysia crispata]|uniref:Uncharacterized protein n=1 Tax=Elysia crispata TaxID=231223 RepID=A0AAE1CXB3_9GAST|nr:hypothetical protein RRG08_011195 [Elysia crispata]